MLLNNDYPAHDPQWVQDVHANQYLQSWSKQGGKPKVITGGQGSWFWDSDGKKYLDFQSQLVNLNLGHQHPKIIQAIKDQLDKLAYIGPAMGNDARSELAAMMTDITPGDLHATFFTAGGAAANETAIRLAKHYTGRSKIVARYRSYHGATQGTLTLTGDPRHHLTRGDMPGVVRMFDPYCYRCPMGHKDSAHCPVSQGGPHLEEILMYEKPETVAAVILEPITGTNGIIVPPPGYLKSIKQVCEQHGILLIADEVMAGFGRAGKWFACEHYDVVPDILTSAKGINSGYIPLGTMTVSKTLADWLQDYPFPGGQTYAGHPVACASGVGAIRAMQEEGTLEQATKGGEHLRAGLEKLADKHACIGQIRGVGMFNGIELVKNRETREPLVPFGGKGVMAEMMAFAMNQGLYLSHFSNVIRLTPPLNISLEDIDLGLEILDRTLDIADAHYNG